MPSESRGDPRPTRHKRDVVRGIDRWLLGPAALVVAAGVVGPGASVSAHTELEATIPAADEVVADPVDAVTLVFTADVTTIDNGFEVLDPSGTVRAPTALEGGGTTQVLRFDPPLAGGSVGVRWAVAAADGHVIEGTFSFVVDAPAPTTAPPSTTSTSTTTTVPPTSTTVAPTTTAATTPPSSVGATDAPATTPLATTSPPTSVAVAPPTTVSGAQLDDFLAGGGPTQDGAQRFGDVGRAIGFDGVVLGVGAVAFGLLVLRPGTGGVGSVSLPTLAGGVLVVFGSIVEGIGHAGAVSGDGLSVIGAPAEIVDALTSTFGVAVALRLFGGLLLVIVCASGARRAAVDGHLPVASAAALALVLSFSFDGHTVGEAPRLVHAVVDVVHVTAASVCGPAAWSS